MSTRDMVLEISPAYKQHEGTSENAVGFIGHDLDLLGEVMSGRSRVFGSIMPNCGPLLIINGNKQRYVTGCTVSFTYRAAEQSGFEEGNIYDTDYEYPVYVEVSGIFSGSVEIPADQRAYSQFLYDDHYVHELLSVSLTDNTQDVHVYCLGDDGARLCYAMNNELTRAAIDTMSRSVWIHPPLCILCSGVGEYPEGTTCPDCNGYKYVGRMADKKPLIDRLKDVNIFQRSEEETTSQYRGWAKKWWLIPTASEIKRYLSHFLRLDERYIDLEESYQPEAIWTVRYPLQTFGRTLMGDIIPVTGTTMLDLVRDIAVAGTQPILEAYYELGSASGIHAYDKNMSSRPHDTGLVDYGVGFVDMYSSWSNSSFGSTFGVSFFNDSGYYGISGTTGYYHGSGYGMTGIEILSGHWITGEEGYPTGFYEYLTLEDVQDVYDYDKPFAQTTGDDGIWRMY